MALSQSATLMPPTTLQDDSLDPTLAALSTLSLLNLRLSRLEHLLSGHTALQTDHHVHSDSTDLEAPSSVPANNTTNSKPISKHNTIPAQLHHLELRLSELKRMDGLPGSLVRMVDTLRTEYPDIFPSSTSTSATSSNSHNLSQQATQVLAHASLYTSTSSRLQTLQTLRIPEATVSAGIMEQGGHLKNLLERQEILEERAAELKRRSVAVLEWWVNVGIKGMGELWEDWEDRVAVCERFVKVHERRAKEERGELEDG